MVIQASLGSLGDWDTAQNELTDPTADGPRPAIGRAVCDAVASDVSGPLLQGIMGGGGTTGVSKFCKPYWESKGGGPQLSPPFTGGQCAGVTYRVRLQRVGATGSTILSPPNVIGPITAMTVSPSFIAANQPAQTQVISVSHAGGVTTFTRNSGTSAQDRTWFVFVDRPDGLPDNCGDPPAVWSPNPSYPTPRPIGSPTNISIGGDNVSIVIGSPEIDIDGDLYFPVTVAGDDSPTTGIPIDNPVAPPNLPDTPPTSESPPTDSDPATGDVEDEVPPSDEGFVIGYCWEVITIASTPPGIPFSSPIVWPNVIGNIRLNYRVGGAVVRGQNVEIDSQRGCLFTPNDKLIVTSCTGNISKAYGTLRLRQVRLGG